MRIGLSHSTYIGDKIAIDLGRSPYINFTKGLEAVSLLCKELLYENIKREQNLEKRVNEVIEENEDEIEYHLADEKELFKMIKKKFAKEEGVLLNYEERFSDLSHTIVRTLFEQELIETKTNDNLLKNIVFDAIDGYLQDRINIEDIVREKIDNLKNRVIPGTDEYSVVFNRLYEDELRAKGVIQQQW